MEPLAARIASSGLRRIPRVSGIQSKPYICPRCQHSNLITTHSTARSFSSAHPCYRATSRKPRMPAPPTVSIQRRGAMAQAVAQEAIEEYYEEEQVAHLPGPIDKYRELVGEGKLRDDNHQRKIVVKLQDLHDQLTRYNPPTVIHPRVEDLEAKSGGLLSFFGAKYDPKADQDKHTRDGNVMFSYDTSLAPKIFDFSGLFNRKQAAPKTQYEPESTPLGLYLHGDVGSGKTMLMNMFYHTLPPNIQRKKRIHFHAFMQDVHRRMHKEKMKHGSSFDALPSVAADLAEEASVLCFDEFQCTDVADAMILRRLLEEMLSHGVVMVATSNRHPNDLYKNGIQRESFIPCIQLLQTRLEVINLDSPTDYRKMSRPASGVYHDGLGADGKAHADKWFSYLGDPKDPPHPATNVIWGREIRVPSASGRAARFDFYDLCGKPMSAADYIELTRHYDAFIVENVPAMDINTKDMARRFITFIDAIYEAKAALVLTSEVPLGELFTAHDAAKNPTASMHDEHGLHPSMRMLMDDLGLDMKALKESSMFTGDEERFAFARALSRLNEMASTFWIENRGA
ncbi:hypothetical protein ABW19_dt0208106 [Dactylella cylindrospora]|nr:hypothetical protein ABW19_dt0208106 [Dactylella cylindrospora]